MEIRVTNVIVATIGILSQIKCCNVRIKEWRGYGFAALSN